MTVRKDVQESIGDEVRSQLNAALDQFRPHGWRRVVHSIRELGPPIAVVAVIVTLFGILLGALYYSFSNVKEEAGFRGDTKAKLEAMGKSIEELKGQVRALQIVQLASPPVDPAKVQQLKQIIGQSKKETL